MSRFVECGSFFNLRNWRSEGVMCLDLSRGLLKIDGAVSREFRFGWVKLVWSALGQGLQ